MRSLPVTFAFRYLFSKKSTNAINVITAVSMLGMCIISAAMVLVLSVFNGFEGLTLSLYNSFNPDLKVVPETGKVFTLSPEQEQQLQNLQSIEVYSKILEEKAALKYGDNEFIGTLKGVDDNYIQVSGVDSALVRGEFILKKGGNSYAVLGLGVEGQLGARLQDQVRAITVLIPSRRSGGVGLMPSSAFNKATIRPVGTFSIQMEFDSKYMFVPLDFIQSLLKYPNEVSALEMKLQAGTDLPGLQQELTTILGPGFEYQDRYQQNAFLYQIMRTEKWATYAIMSFILAIAAFNIIGSLSMLVLEKTKDIAILKTMGATSQTIRRIFLLEGLLSSLIGATLGIGLALLFCWLQIQFGLIPLPGSGSFVISAMPVEVKVYDLLLIAATVMSISLLASWIPAYRTAKMGNLVRYE